MVNCNFLLMRPYLLSRCQYIIRYCTFTFPTLYQCEWLIDRNFPYIEHSIIFGSWAKYENYYSFSFCPCAAPQREFTLKPCHLPFRCWKHFCFAGGMGGNGVMSLNLMSRSLASSVVALKELETGDYIWKVGSRENSNMCIYTRLDWSQWWISGSEEETAGGAMVPEEVQDWLSSSLPPLSARRQPTHKKTLQKCTKENV